jgi:hypothetical protein
MKHYGSKSVVIDGLVFIEDVSVSFEATTETFPAEPYSWGSGRGEETEITDVTFTGIQVGGLVLNEEQAVQMFGADAIEAVRERIDLDDL